MLVPKDTVEIEETEQGYVARTTLIEGPTGTGRTAREAAVHLDWAVRAHLKIARALGRDIPDRFRVSTRRRVLLVVLFLVFVAALPVLVRYVWTLWA
jgi:hypothetical protein